VKRYEKGNVPVGEEKCGDGIRREGGVDGWR